MRGSHYKEMSRDSLFGERIVWAGKPARVGMPPLAKVICVATTVMALVGLLFAIVANRALDAHVGGMVVFSAWCATLALASWRLPLWWLSSAEYLLTDRHVIWRRGKIRRSIERSAISYARIVWHEGDVGDLTLVRAVPTGALRRTLSLTLSGVRAPDRLWAIVRGVSASVPLGDGDRPLAQRLDAGERVVWSGTPKASAWSVRRIASACVSGLLFLAAARMLTHAVPAVARLVHQDALSRGLSAMLIVAVSLAGLLLIASAIGIGYWAIVRPLRLLRATRYLVTNRRVLIRRGREELHLDRSRIAYVISAEGRGISDVFLVLDGPQARALAPSGAFDERSDSDTLVPVLSAIEDAETVGAILREASRESLPEAA